jgi:hypothetical protein
VNHPDNTDGNKTPVADELVKITARLSAVIDSPHQACSMFPSSVVPTGAKAAYAHVFSLYGRFFCAAGGANENPFT